MIDKALRQRITLGSDIGASFSLLPRRAIG